MSKSAVGASFLAAALVLIIALTALALTASPNATALVVLGVLGGILALTGYYTLVGHLPFQRIQVSQTGFDITFIQEEVIVRKELPPDVKQKREAIAHNNHPAADAPEFSAITDVPDLAGIPGADSMTPMYMLDRNFRILDWNEAFSLAFDRTMEGRRGKSAIEWVYFLDNFNDVLNHANATFADLNNPPRFDKEDLHFTSVRYGRIVATKRAYQLLDDRSEYSGWIVVLDVKFQEPEKGEQYRRALIRTLQRTLLWSEYALSYDEVLTKLPSYEELLKKMVGEAGRLPPIADGAKVLDLGAGTGNLALRLANGHRTIFCIENNRTMLALLQNKCRQHLRKNNHQPGIIALKQDLVSLHGLPKNYFDVVIANNVLYSVSNQDAALAAIQRSLKPGGELRFSGPAPGVHIQKLFDRFKKELTNSGAFEPLRTHFEQALYINLLLQNDLTQWSRSDLAELLEKKGLTPAADLDTAYYYGHGIIRMARKE